MEKQLLNKLSTPLSCQNSLNQKTSSILERNQNGEIGLQLGGQQKTGLDDHDDRLLVKEVDEVSECQEIWVPLEEDVVNQVRVLQEKVRLTLNHKS